MLYHRAFEILNRLFELLKRERYKLKLYKNDDAIKIRSQTLEEVIGSTSYNHLKKFITAYVISIGVTHLVLFIR